MTTYIAAIVCVLGLAVGQILFKLSASYWSASGSLLDTKTALVLFVAITLYGLITILWVWVLQKADLGRVYPLMALAFVLVPIGSYFVFKENFTSQYFIGIAIIITGIVITVKA